MIAPWFDLIVVWAGAAVAMGVAWLWQRRHQNIGIVDVCWAASLGVGAIIVAVLGDGALVTRLLLAVFGGGWGLRLALHLWARVGSEAEDGRYRHLRRHWHGDQRRIFLFFQAQALLVVLFALPFAAVARNPADDLPWLTLATAFWLLSVVGEAAADGQLARFRAAPGNRGKTCRVGLWRYSRHPNYFFEWLHWFTYVFLAIGSDWWGLAAVGPLVMFLFLRFLSGIPWTEAQALRSRGDDYRDYQRRTPMLFPWFPRKPEPSPETPASDHGVKR